MKDIFANVVRGDYGCDAQLLFACWLASLFLHFWELIVVVNQPLFLLTLSTSPAPDTELCTFTP